MELSLLELIVSLIIVVIGTAVQASIGFGLGMIAAPLLLLINRQFIPGPLIFASFVLVLWMSWDERHAIDMKSIKAAIAGRICGTAPAALLIGSVSVLAFDIIFAVLVLLAVLISLIKSDIRATPSNVFFATTLSGFMSVISSIGGPPIALIYQNSHGADLRANLSALFAMGCVVSLFFLMLIGRFRLADLYLGLLLSVGVLVGAALARPLKKYINKNKTRPYLLGLCGLSAIVVLIEAVIKTGYM